MGVYALKLSAGKCIALCEINERLNYDVLNISAALNYMKPEAWRTAAKCISNLFTFITTDAGNQRRKWHKEHPSNQPHRS
jgi:hypothetical protein